MNNEILIYDIETATLGSRPDPKTDVFKFFGAYSYKTKKYYVVTKSEDIRKLIKHHKYLVGFNTIQYDNQVLFNNGFNDIIQKKRGDFEDYNFKYKINIDLMQIFKKRAGMMKVKKGMLGDLLMHYSLDYITKTLDLVDDGDGKIKDFDYNILKKKVFTSDDLILIKTYLKRDLEVTKKLYDFVENYFEGFKDFLKEEDVEKKTYLTCSTAVFAYKVICKKLGWFEEYDNAPHIKYDGAYVSYPAGNSFEGNIFCLDYNSLYPHCMIQCNLYSKDVVGWSGGKFKVTGTYNDKTLGQVESLLKEFYNLRLEYKKVKDKREYTLKIVLNTIYGTLGNPAFKKLYDSTAAGDCTKLARQWILLARKKFREAGYENLYTDTDSCYILDNFNDKEKMLKVKQSIIDEIKENVPFPQDTFDMGIDDEITHMWFFKNTNKLKEKDLEMDDDDFLNKSKNLMKKNYIYLTKDNRIVYKNLGVKKKSTSLLTRKIFNDFLIPKIKSEKVVKWDRSYFKTLINKLLETDLSLIMKRFNVKEMKEYKSATNLSYQISKMYGSGIHFLIKNKKIGVGKGTKYCTLDEFNNRKMTINDIDLDGVWKELAYFIKEKEKVDLNKWF